MAERAFPILKDYKRERQGIADPVTVSWAVAAKAYEEYIRRFGRCQTLECIAKRGGFGVTELDDLYPDWRSHA